MNVIFIYLKNKYIQFINFYTFAHLKRRFLNKLNDLKTI